jgi:hypothetical protein
MNESFPMIRSFTKILAASAESAPGEFNFVQCGFDQPDCLGLVAAETVGRTMQGRERGTEAFLGLGQIREGLLRDSAAGGENADAGGHEGKGAQQGTAAVGGVGRCNLSMSSGVAPASRNRRSALSVAER